MPTTSMVLHTRLPLLGTGSRDDVFLGLSAWRGGYGGEWWSRGIGGERTRQRNRVLRVPRTRATFDRDTGSKRLVDVVRRVPRIAKTYFKDPWRRALFGGIAILVGFYVAQTISLSFGALNVNDVIAAAMCVLFTEYVTRFTRTRKKISFTVALVNNFKMGFTYGLFIDAFKLAS